MRQLESYSASFLALLILGCGSTHQTLPLHPLERRDILFTLTWHGDLSTRTLPAFSPDVNLYFGLGGGNVFGTGTTTPIPSISHLTFAHYAEVNEGTRFIPFVTVNQLTAVTPNPYFEIGAGYLRHKGSFSDLLSAGIGIGHGREIPLLVEPRKALSQPLRVFPILKYQFGGDKYGGSLTFHGGLTRHAVAEFYRAFYEENDTLYVIAPDSVSSMLQVSLPDSLDPKSGTLIGFRNGGRLFLGARARDSVSIPLLGPSFFIGSSDPQRVTIPDDSSFAYVSFSRIHHDWESRQPIVILRYDPKLLGFLKWTRTFWSDFSAGFVIQQFHPSRSSKTQ